MASNKNDSVWMGVARSFSNLVSGLVVVCTLLGVAFRTDPFSILYFALMLSICTAGLPIIVLVAVSYFVGSLVNSMIFQRKGSRQPSNRQVILMDYIESSRQKGMSKEVIVKGLVEVGGWKIEEIEDAYKELET